jgi:hypothetical protein
MKIVRALQKIISNINKRKLFSSGFKMSGLILLIVIMVVMLFLFTGKVFVELFGWLVFPFPRRENKKKP